MHVTHKRETNAFVLISASESATYGSSETLNGKGKMARPALFAWLRIAPVVIAQMPEVLGPVDVSWNELHPTMDQRVEDASIHMAKSLSLLFRPIVARSYYDFDFSREYREKGLNRMIFCARCVPTVILAKQVPLADSNGLYVPIPQGPLMDIYREMKRKQRLIARGQPVPFTIGRWSLAKDTRINLDFTISYELCEFTLEAMKCFSDKLVKLRRERLKKSNEMVFR
ncbi:MAG: hypothetical protein RLZZ347_601 [Candidatus Parcubacteria bacterium]